jgi:hypothetical protein
MLLLLHQQHLPFGFPVGVLETLLCYLGATFKHLQVIWTSHSVGSFC